ncbi:hypothetical protein BJX99DRAFT_227041 [Aspergillus californicus]
MARKLPRESLKCDQQFLIKRKRLEDAIKYAHTPTPKVHIGLVGSRDTVMKSGMHRDAIASFTTGLPLRWKPRVSAIRFQRLS